eukprot:751366-Hanusia_phi.AAC.4
MPGVPGRSSDPGILSQDPSDDPDRNRRTVLTHWGPGAALSDPAGPARRRLSPPGSTPRDGPICGYRPAGGTRALGGVRLRAKPARLVTRAAAHCQTSRGPGPGEGRGLPRQGGPRLNHTDSRPRSTQESDLVRSSRAIQ